MIDNREVDNNMINETVRPFIADVEKVKNELVQAINIVIQNNNVPCYFLLPVFTDIFSQISAAAKSELEESQWFAQVQAQAVIQEQQASAQEQQRAQTQSQEHMPPYKKPFADQPVPPTL